VFKVVVAAGCLYELAALPPRSPLPTISRLCNAGVDHTSPAARLAAWMFAGGLALHLLGLDRPVSKRIPPTPLDERLP